LKYFGLHPTVTKKFQGYVSEAEAITTDTIRCLYERKSNILAALVETVVAVVTEEAVDYAKYARNLWDIDALHERVERIRNVEEQMGERLFWR
jgi:hypothetical protein